MGKNTRYNTNWRREARKKKKLEDPVGYRAELNKRNEKNRILKEQNPSKYEEMRGKQKEKLQQQTQEEHEAKLAHRRQQRQAVASLTQLAVAAEVSIAADAIVSVSQLNYPTIDTGRIETRTNNAGVNQCYSYGWDKSIGIHITASRCIYEGAVLGEYAGERINKAEMMQRLRRGADKIMQVSASNARQIYVDGMTWGARLTHACDCVANCSVSNPGNGRLTITAQRTIKKGEIMTIDYGIDPDEVPTGITQFEWLRNYQCPVCGKN